MSIKNKCIQVEERNGVQIVTFTPTPKMELFAFARAQAQFAKFNDEELGRHFGLGKNYLKNCQDQCDPHFTEWYEEAVNSYGSSQRRAILELIGFKKAFAGEFNFWKVMSIKEKVIDPDQANLNILPSSLGELSNLTDQQIEDYNRAILAKLQPSQEQGSPSDFESDPRGEQGSHDGGTLEMPEEPLALPKSLGQD